MIKAGVAAILLLGAAGPAVAANETDERPPLAERDGRALFGDAETRVLRYKFSVDDVDVGTAEGEIVRTGDNSWRVRATYRIKVEIAGLDLYELEMTTKERYLGRRLVAVDTTSVENGEKHRVLGKAEGDHFLYSRDGGEQRRARDDIVPSTQLWRRGLLTRTHVLHVVEGETFDRMAESLGDKAFETAFGSKTLAGFHIDTPYETAEIWYDENGLMMRAVLDRMGTTLVITRQPEPKTQPEPKKKT